MRKSIETSAMRKRGAMQHAIRLSKIIDIGIISKHHRRECPMGKRRTLWLAGSATRVEKPCWIFRCNGLQLQRTARKQSLILQVFGAEHGVKSRDFIDKGRERTGKIRRCHADPSARIFKDVSELS